MKKLIRKLRRLRVQFVQSSRKTKRAVLLMTAISMVALIVLNVAITAIVEETQKYKDRGAQLEYENDQLEDKNDNAGTLEGALDYAEDELGMVPTDAVVIQPET